MFCSELSSPRSQGILNCHHRLVQRYVKFTTEHSHHKDQFKNSLEISPLTNTTLIFCLYLHWHRLLYILSSAFLCEALLCFCLLEMSNKIKILKALLKSRVDSSHVKILNLISYEVIFKNKTIFTYPRSYHLISSGIPQSLCCNIVFMSLGLT